MRPVHALLWSGGVAVGLAGESVAFGLDDPRRAIPDLVAGWTLLAAGLVASSRESRSRTGPLLAATGFSWFAGNFVSAALYVHRGPLVHVLLAYPSGRVVSRLGRTAVVIGYAAAVVTPVWESEIAALVLSAALGVVAALGYRSLVGRERRARAVSLVATEAIVLVLATGAAARLAFPGGDADEPALFAYQLALSVVAVALASGLVSRTWERTPLTDLAVELRERRSGTLRDALSRALGDPTLELGYWAPEVGGYVDGDGHTLRLPASGSKRAVTRVERDGQALAVLVHDPAVLDDPLLVESIAAATRLAASNARLQAALRTQVAELESSRRRLIEAGDDERRRLEQRLRVGAERRFASLAETLARARARSGGHVSTRIARAEEVLARTREDLQELAQGLHPASLTDQGLPGALASLAAESAVPVELTVCEAPLAREVEATVYFVCAEALANATKYACATHVAIAVRRRDGHVAVDVADDGVGGADLERGTGLRGLSDRLAAGGGQLRIDSPAGGGTRLVAEIPFDEAR